MMEITAENLTFRLKSWGPPEAPPVLLLSHVPDVSFSLDRLAANLAASKPARRVLVPERIDVGPDPHFRAIADDIAKLLQSLPSETRLTRLDVVGIGFGGTVAVFLATAAPQLVRAVALLDTPLPNLHSLNADLVRRLADAYAYVADFLDPGFEAAVAAGDDGLLRQFWEHASWWPEQEARYRSEFSDRMLGPDPHFRAIADDIAKLLQSLPSETRLTRLDVVGIGFGGTVAVFLATAAPQLVRAVALLDTPRPNLHSLNADLVRRLADAYAYVADFLDPGFEAAVAAGDDVVYCGSSGSMRRGGPEQEARYRSEFSDPGFT